MIVLLPSLAPTTAEQTHEKFTNDDFKKQNTAVIACLSTK